MCVLGLLLLAPHAHAAEEADAFPSNPVTIVVGFSAGGSTDVIARLLAEGMAKRLNRQFVVENRPGADSAIAAQYVAKRPANGYTLFLASASMTINYGVRKSLPYDPLKDFAAIGKIGFNQNVFVTHPSVPGTTIKEVVESSKSGPGYFYSSGSTNAWLAIERLKKLTGLRAERVPFLGSSQSTPMLLSGQVQLASTTVLTALPFIKSGQLKPIMVNGNQREPLLPTIPTARELGVDVVDAPWYGLVGPAGLPQPIRQKLYAAMSATLQDPAVKQKLDDLAIILDVQGPDTFDRYIVSQSKYWKEEAAALNVSGD